MIFTKPATLVQFCSKRVQSAYQSKQTVSAGRLESLQREGEQLDYSEDCDEGREHCHTRGDALGAGIGADKVAGMIAGGIQAPESIWCWMDVQINVE